MSPHYAGGILPGRAMVRRSVTNQAEPGRDALSSIIPWYARPGDTEI